jgi:hypothetical protein
MIYSSFVKSILVCPETGAKEYDGDKGLAYLVVGNKPNRRKKDEIV